MILMRSNKLIILLLIAVVIFLGFSLINTTNSNKEFKLQNSNFVIQIDSLKAENKLLTAQSDYLIQYFDSTRKKIPQLKGFAFIADSIMDRNQ